MRKDPCRGGDRPLGLRGHAASQCPNPAHDARDGREGGTAIFDTLERWREKGTEPSYLGYGSGEAGQTIRHTPADNLKRKR